MPIDYPAVLDLTRNVELRWDERDVMLYALGIGCGADPLDRDELRLVTEHGLKVMPTIVAAWAVPAMASALAGHDRTRSLQSGQAIRIHRPLPTRGAARAEGRMVAVHDRGQGRGALLRSEVQIIDRATGDLLATTRSTSFARADGGFGGPTDPPPMPHAMPDRPPDATLELPTRPDQGLLYRLSGDYNPLHADPDIARRAGFEAPILHGLCSYGITARAVIKAFAAQDPDRLIAHEARFSAPVFPGDLLTIDLWRDGAIVSFQARVVAHNLVAIGHGRSEITV